MVRKDICVTALAGLLCLLAPLALGQAVEELAAAVTQDVGVILQLIPGDGRVIFLFEERHDSALVQVEIAIMLNRLYADYGLRHIGLEGLAESEGPLDCSWAHRPPPYHPGRPITPREDVIVQTLQDGEISAAEMMGLIYEDVVVDGIDDAALYAIPAPSGEAWSAPYNYLYSIALAGMSQVERIAWQALLDQGKEWEAFQLAVSTDEFTQRAFERLEDEVDVASPSELIALYGELRAVAERVGAELPPGAPEALDRLAEYMETVDRRSRALAENMLALVEAHPEAPLAMCVGAAHTDRAVEAFAAAGVSVVAVRTRAQAEGTEAGLLSAEAFFRKHALLSVDPDGWLGSFLDGRTKPPPVSREDWYKTGLAIRELLQRVVEAAARAREKRSAISLVRAAMQGWAARWGDLLRRTGILSRVTLLDASVEGDPTVVLGLIIRGRSVVVTCRLAGPEGLAASLAERLRLARGELWSQEPTQEETPTRPQRISSNTEAIWTIAG